MVLHSNWINLETDFFISCVLVLRHWKKSEAVMYNKVVFKMGTPKNICSDFSSLGWPQIGAILANEAGWDLVERNKASWMVSAAHRGDLFRQFRHIQPCSSETQNSQSIMELFLFYIEVSPLMCFWKFIFASCYRISSPGLVLYESLWLPVVCAMLSSSIALFNGHCILLTLWD